jgi:uncharacterized protein (DUF58 family)
MLTSVANSLEKKAAAWARRRQGPDRGEIVLRRRRIYILPTRYGVMFGLLVFAMLLGSMNYSASLGFALTFLLGGLGIVAMHHCRNGLLGAELRYAGAKPVFAGEHAEFRIAVTNPGAAPRYEIRLERGSAVSQIVDLAPGESRILALRVPAPRRGYLPLGRCAVTTRHPGGLFCAWAWLYTETRCLVYPAPADAGRPPPLGAGGPGLAGHPDSGDADFTGLRAAAPGDPPQRLAWKAFARNDELLVKQFASGQERVSIFAWDALTDLDPERRLAQLARWCIDAARVEREAFGLQLPSATIPAGRGEAHLHECLKALALCEAVPG